MKRITDPFAATEPDTRLDKVLETVGTVLGALRRGIEWILPAISSLPATLRTVRDIALILAAATVVTAQFAATEILRAVGS